MAGTPRAWVRPYAPGKGRLVVAGWELGALAFLHATTVDLFHLERFDTQLAVGLFGLWVALCWRLAVMGVYTSAHGVLIRGLVTRRVLPWCTIRRIGVDDTAVTVGRFSVPTGRAIRFDTSAGTSVHSTLYADGIDFKFRPGLFRQLHDDLRRQHAAATLETVER